MGLRILVAAVALDGLVALVVADLLGAAVAALAGVACLAGSYASYAFPTPSAVARRKALSVGILVVVAGYAAYATTGQHAQTIDGVTQVGPLLSGLLVGVQLAQSVVQNARRDLLVGLVVAWFMTVLAAGLAPGPGVAGPVLLAWPAGVLAMVLAHRLTESAGADAVAAPHATVSGAPVAGHPAGRVAAVVTVCLLAGLAVFLVLPRTDGYSARSRMLGGEAPGQSQSVSTESRSASFYTQGYLDLRARGGLADDPVLEVPVDSPALWRTTVLDLYDGAGWQSSRTGGRAVGSGPDFRPPLDADEVVPAGTALRTDDVVLRTGWSGAVAAPGPVTAVHADTGQLVQVGPGLALFDVTGGVRTYAVTSVPEDLDATVLRQATGADTISRVWTELPAEVPLRVRQLAAEVTAHASTRYDAVDAVDRYLRGNETYRLDSPVPAPGEDPVDDFLFVSHQGFCEQFASAAVVLLRSRGIPARLATGFGYGQPAAEGRRRVMLASDAHAWIEVWYPGVGWSASDPTAGAPLAPPSQPSLVSRALEAVESFASSPAGRVVLALALLGFGMAGVGALWLARRLRGRRRRAASQRPVGPVLAAFWRLQAAMARTGTRSPPAETLAEFAFRLPTAARGAVAVLERECYGPAAPADSDASAAAATFDRLTAELENAARR